jgi:hypothetical protein
MNTKSIWTNERKEIATWLSGYLAMVKKWVDKILDNEDHDVDKIKILNQINDWIRWLEDTKSKIMKMRDVDPEEVKEKEERVPEE